MKSPSPTPSLFGQPDAYGGFAPGATTFGGSTFDPVMDGPRLGTQLRRVFDLMADGNWRTLADIANVVPGKETALSARLRDLRRPEHGGHTVEHRRVDGMPGVWEYRVIVRKETGK